MVRHEEAPWESWLVELCIHQEGAYTLPNFSLLELDGGCRGIARKTKQATLHTTTTLQSNKALWVRPPPHHCEYNTEWNKEHLQRYCACYFCFNVTVILYVLFMFQCHSDIVCVIYVSMSQWYCMCYLCFKVTVILYALCMFQCHSDIVCVMYVSMSQWYCMCYLCFNVTVILYVLLMFQCHHRGIFSSCVCLVSSGERVSQWCSNEPSNLGSLGNNKEIQHKTDKANNNWPQTLLWQFMPQWHYRDVL